MILKPDGDTTAADCPCARKISASLMPGTKRAVQRGTARAVSCTRDALDGGEEADGCCATKRSSMPGFNSGVLFERKNLDFDCIVHRV